VGPAARAALVVVVLAVTAGAGWLTWHAYLARSDEEGGPGAGDRAGAGGRAGFGGLGADEVAPTLHAGLDPRRIAVLYFDDHSPGRSLRYLADGLTEELQGALTRVGPLDVLSSNAVRPVRDGRITADSLIRALRVGTYVEGSVERSGDRVRVNVDLIDASTGSQLAVHTIERPMGELFALQDSLVAEVSETLRRRLGVEVEARRSRTQTTSVEAWTLVQRAGRLMEGLPDLWATDTANARRGLDRADSLLARAAAADPRWPEPEIRRGWLARMRARYAGVIPGQATAPPLRAGLDDADRALRLAADDPDALELRGTLESGLARVVKDSAQHDTLLARAERDLRSAVGRDSTLAEAWWQLGEIERQRDRFAESVRLSERALREDAYLQDAPQIMRQLFYTSFETEDIARARHWCGEGRRRFPGWSDFVLCQLLVDASVESVPPAPARARALADTVVLLSPAADSAAWRAYATLQVAKVYARAGEPDSARAWIARTYVDGSPQPWLAYDEAHARLLLGEKARALELLRGYLKAHPDRRAYWPKDWWLRSLWSDPGFKAMVGGRAGAG